MAVKASPEIIREMKQDLEKTVRDLQQISSGIRSVLKQSPEWDDEQSRQFLMLMRRIAQLTEEPSATLRSSIPKLERLAEALDEYGRVRF